MKKPSLRNLLSTSVKVLLVFMVTYGTAGFAQKGKIKFSFNNAVQFGTQKNNLRVMVSSDFKGDYSMEGIKAATWKDITDLYSLTTGKEFESAGAQDISSYIEKGKPLYIAFKYQGEASAKPSQRGWAIQNPEISGKGITPKVFQISDFKIVNNPANTPGAGWGIGKESSLRFVSKQSLIESESWAIVKAIE